MSKRCILIMSHRTIKSQSGSAILIAIFIVIVISLLGASLVSLQRDSAESTSYEVYAARAYLAAYSASEVALTELFPLSSSADCSAVSTSPSLPSDNNGFHGCSVSLSCTTLTSTGSESRYQLVSTAVCQTQGVITRRQITVEATDL